MEKILLVGPYPPPEHGTSIPFGIFCESLGSLRNKSVLTRILNTQSGDKAVVSFWNAKVLYLNAKMLLLLPGSILWADKVIIFGSQRFCTTLGIVIAAISGILRKSVYVRIIGGGYDQYFAGKSLGIRQAIICGMRLYDKVVFETELVRREMAKVWPSRVFYAPNYRRWPGEVKRRRHEEDSVGFIYTGILRKPKGCEEMLEAFRITRQILTDRRAHIRISLDLYGPVYDGVQDNVDMTGVSEDPDIRVHGNVDGDVIWEGLARADVFLFPSYWASEGHSGAVIEAMMVGIPVIAARWRSTPEVVVDGVDGLLCEPRDAKSLAEQMVRIALDEALRARLGNRAKQTARRFDAAIICGQLRELFEIGC